VPLNGGSPIADSFHRTVALVSLLELRAAQLRAPNRRGARARRPWIRYQPRRG
jgi:hypothetical protein